VKKGFENKYDITYKLLIEAFILLALCSMLHPVMAVNLKEIHGDPIVGANITF
jgi:hypothetical protein